MKPGFWLFQSASLLFQSRSTSPRFLHFQLTDYTLELYQKHNEYTFQSGASPLHSINEKEFKGGIGGKEKTSRKGEEKVVDGHG